MNLRNDVRILKRALKIIWKSSASWTIARGFILVSQAFISLSFLYFLKTLVDDISVIITTENAEKKVSIDLIYDLIILAFILFVNSANDLASKFISSIQQQKLTDYLQDKVQTKASEVEYAYYEDPNYYNSFHWAQQEAVTQPDALIENLSKLGMSLFTLMGISILLISFHWWIILVLILVMVPKAFLKLKFTGRIFAINEKETGSDRLSHYISSILSDAKHAKDIRIFNLKNPLREIFLRIRVRILKEKYGTHEAQLKSLLLLSVFQISALVFVLYIIAQEGIEGAITIGSIVMLFQAVLKTQGHLSNAVVAFVEVHQQKLFLNHLFAFLDLHIPKSKHEPIISTEIIKGITLKNVSFKYESSSVQTLKDINLHLKPGQIIGLAGENGSGKSSLIKLLCGLYVPQNGNIELDGLDFSSFSKENLWANSTVLFQDFAKFNLSLRFNITGTDEKTDEARLNAAIQQSGTEAIVNKLANGVDTILGRQFSNAQELSGGEWQRIALARLFYKNSSIIILDEPSSFMDGKEESIFLDHLQKIKHDKIIVIASHRLSNLKIADWIYILKNGNIISEGKHEILASKSLEYRNLFNAQFNDEIKFASHDSST